MSEVKYFSWILCLRSTKHFLWFCKKNDRGRGQSVLTKLNVEAAAFISQQHSSSGSSRPYYKSAGNHPFHKNRPLCSHCGIHGHTIEKCYRIHGYPPGYKTNRAKTSSANQLSIPAAHKYFQIT